MSQTYVLDTHAWVWLLLSYEKLSSKVRHLLSTLTAEDRILISAITLVEVVTLAEKGKLDLAPSVSAWIEHALKAHPIQVKPLDYKIALATADLDVDHYDPADRIILATAIAENAVLITADRVLRSSSLVTTFW